MTQEIANLEKEIRTLKNALDKFLRAPRVTLGARGGWWYVKDRPQGKGSVKKQGVYIRDPFQK